MVKKLVICFTIFIISGCTSSYLKNMDIQSKFDYPNSNVIVLNRVRGEASKTTFGNSVAGVIDPELERQAVDDALRKSPEADFIINSFHFVETTNFIFLPITTTKYIVEGTAVKQEIGSQK